MAPTCGNAQGSHPLGIASARGRNGYGSQPNLAQQIQHLLGVVPPAGHSHQLLNLWLERHALERRLELQHQAGSVVDRFPTCPVQASRQVDLITVRIDAITALLGHLAAGAWEGRP